jgi:hypothetical protein
MHKGDSRSTTIPRRWALLAVLLCLLVISACGRQANQAPTAGEGEVEQVELLVSDPVKETELGALEGKTVSGTIIVSLNDRRNLEYVNFFLNDRDGRNAPVGTDDTNPYTFAFDTTTVANGQHTITAIGYGKNGRVRVTGHATFTVDNPDATPPADGGDEEEGEDEGEGGRGEDEGEEGGEEEQSPASDKLIVVAVTASSHDGNVPENVLDGDLNTRWSANGVGEWIQFDLGAEQEVNRLAIAWFRGDTRKASFEVHLSNDTHGWEKVFEGKSSGTTVEREQYGFAQTRARYVRIFGLGNSSNAWNSITVVELYGEQVNPVDSTEPEPAPEPEPTPPVGREAFSLRGDTNFSESQLSDEARLWYRRFWSAVNHPNQFPDMTSRANSDNIYHYARDLYRHYLALLTAFRITGDLRLLDEIERLTQIQRNKLADGWRGTLDGTDGTSDGFLNWVDRHHSNNASLYGKDTGEVNEIKAHSILAMIAYVFELNRDLPSPSGADYGERADFWKYYLTEHFEAKWRSRNKVAEGSFPFIIRNWAHTHSAVTSISYHYYMYRLTGVEGYLSVVEHQTNRFFNEARVVNASGREAYVWRRQLGGGTADYLMPTVYTRYIMADALNFYFEGLARWNDPSTMSRLANAVTHFIMDNGSDDFARDIGGGVSRGGYSASPTSWARETPDRYALSSFSWMAPWDSSGKIVTVSQQVYSKVEANIENPRRANMILGLFLEAAMRN